MHYNMFVSVYIAAEESRGKTGQETTVTILRDSNVWVPKMQISFHTYTDFYIHTDLMI